MIAQAVTSLLALCPGKRRPRGGGAVIGRVQVAFRLRDDRLRHLSIMLLLLALGAVLLQPVAHAGAGGHPAHQDVAAITQPCTGSHASGDGTAVEHCDSGTAGFGLLDCCQACLVAAIPPDPQALPPFPGNGHLSSMRPDPSGRIPAAILRPPRLIATA